MTVYERPTVAQVEAAYDFPAYLRGRAKPSSRTRRIWKPPQFTKAELKIHPSTPIARGNLVIDGQKLRVR